ncbi:MAG TPA: ABC transporter permease [Gemmatimonas sp.]|nr:ABC transporter permease [Gemmatimonas sp.]
MSALLFDLRYALRGLRRTPAFTVVVLLTLALGIGANSAIFSVVNTVLLKPLPYKEPDRLITIYHDYPSLKLEAPITAPGFRDYRDRTRSFEYLAVGTGWAANLTGQGDPERVSATRVSQQFFPALGVSLLYGRGFLPTEEQPGSDKVVVLGYGLWMRLFAGDKAAVGKSIPLNGEPYLVVGVMPGTFVDPWNRTSELWAPLAFTPAQLESQNEYLAVTARLKPGVGIAAAQADLTALAAALQAERGGEASGYGLLAKPVTKVLVGNMRTPLFVLLGAVGFVLLIACANVANLFLVRASGRQKEITLRTALGAQRWPLIRQLLVESMTLSILGGALGLALAWGSIRLLVASNPANIPRLQELHIDARVVAFTALVAIVTGVLFGVFPALRTTRTNLHEGLKDGGRAGSGDRVGAWVRRTLVVAEVALALTLLVGGGLMLRSFARLSDVNPGFNAGNLLTFNVSLPVSKYESDTARRAFFAEAVAKLSAVPGVQGAAVATVLPFSGGWATGSFNVEGFEVPPDTPSPWGDQRTVSAGYFETMGAPLIAGRFIDETDRLGGVRVAVVDDEFVKRFYKPGESAIGKRFWFGDEVPTDSTIYTTIVGVVGHARHEGLDAEARVQIYRPYAQVGGGGGAAIVLRTTGDPLAMVPTLRTAIHGIDRDLPLANIRTMEKMIDDSMGRRRLSTTLLGTFSAIALLLATIGIYGVMAYSVSQRQRELGIRMALGSTRDRVLRLVLRQGMQLALAGVAIGLFGAFALTRLVESQLYGVEATDPTTFVAVTALLTSVALAASLVPAMRATRVDPAIALRDE